MKLSWASWPFPSPSKSVVMWGFSFVWDISARNLKFLLPSGVLSRFMELSAPFQTSTLDLAMDNSHCCGLSAWTCHSKTRVDINYWRNLSTKLEGTWLERTWAHRKSVCCLSQINICTPSSFPDLLAWIYWLTVTARAFHTDDQDKDGQKAINVSTFFCSSTRNWTSVDGHSLKSRTCEVQGSLEEDLTLPWTWLTRCKSNWTGTRSLAFWVALQRLVTASSLWTADVWICQQWVLLAEPAGIVGADSQRWTCVLGCLLELTKRLSLVTETEYTSWFLMYCLSAAMLTDAAQLIIDCVYHRPAKHLHVQVCGTDSLPRASLRYMHGTHTTAHSMVLSRKNPCLAQVTVQKGWLSPDWLD